MLRAFFDDAAAVLNLAERIARELIRRLVQAQAIAEFVPQVGACNDIFVALGKRRLRLLRDLLCRKLQRLHLRA